MARWKQTLWIMFFAQFVSATGFSIIFPFLPLYVQSLGSTTGISIEFWAGMVFSSQAITMMIASPVWGALADRYGRKVMAERAMFGGALTILLMAFARSAEDLVLLRTLQGCITGTIPAASALVAAVTPRERVGYAMGMLQVGFRSGIAAGPLIGGVLADTLGFRAPFVITAVLLLLSGFLVLFGIEEQFTPPELAPGTRINLLAGWRHILALPGTALIFGLSFLLWLGQNMIWPIAPLFIQNLMHQSTQVGTMTGLVIGIASATGTASAVYLGRLGDRVGHRWILIGCALLAALCYLPQSIVTAAWQLLLLQAVTGAAFGGMTPALSALLVYATNPGEEGNVYGLDSSVTSAARAVAPLVGAALAVWLGLRGIFLAAGAVYLVGAALALVGLPRFDAQQVAARWSRQPGD